MKVIRRRDEPSSPSIQATTAAATPAPEHHGGGPRSAAGRSGAARAEVVGQVGPHPFGEEHPGVAPGGRGEDGDQIGALGLDLVENPLENQPRGRLAGGLAGGADAEVVEEISTRACSRTYRASSLVVSKWA